MTQETFERVVITGTPLIGEGNIVDNKSMRSVLERKGISTISFYPNGPFVWMARQFHISMTMNTKKTMDYAFSSARERSSLKVLPLRWELRRAVKQARLRCPRAICFITSQSILAEESVGNIGDVPTITMSSDVFGKMNLDSRPSERQRRIIYLVWNREALDFYHYELKMCHVHLIMPVDPGDAFKHIEKADLPFHELLDDPKLCIVKLSGSGGDPGLVNAGINSLWEKSRVRCMVFAGTEKTRRMIIHTVGKDVKVGSSLDPAVFYNQARGMISNEHMLLVYPSEQVKHLVVLASNHIFPRVVWLPPRGEHEVMNIAWAIKQGFSGTVCIPAEYHDKLNRRLIGLGVRPSDIELTAPERLSAQHFRPTTPRKQETTALPLDHVIRKVADIS